LDRQGVIRGVWLGVPPSAVEEMRQSIERLLEEG